MRNVFQSIATPIVSWIELDVMVAESLTYR